MKTVTPAFVVTVITSRPLGARGKRVGGGGMGFAIECGGVRGLENICSCEVEGGLSGWIDGGFR